MHKAALIGAFGFAWAALAQTPPSPVTAADTLTLAQAEAIALKNHPKIAVAQSLESAAGQRVTEARSPYYPALNGEVTASQANYGARLGAGALVDSTLFSRQGEGLALNQLVTDLGRTKNLVASSRLQQQAAAQTTQSTRYDVILAVNRAFYEVLEAQALIKVAQETVHARQVLTDQVTALAKAQLKSQLDVSFAQVNLSEAQLLLIRAQDSLKQSWADLTRALGVDTAPVEYRLVDMPQPDAPPSDTEALVGQAVQNRPELSELRLLYQSAQRFEEAEKDLKKPNLTFIAVAGGLPYLDQNPRIAPDGYEAAALNLEIPIFNGHLFSARRQAAHYESLAANQRLRELQQQVQHDVRAAWLTASNAWQRIPVTKDLLGQATLALELAQGRYNLGLASIVEVTQSQLNLTEAQIENVNAGYDYQNAYAALQYTLGALH
jgi:outer membrane protein